MDAHVRYNLPEWCSGQETPSPPRPLMMVVVINSCEVHDGEESHHRKNRVRIVARHLFIPSHNSGGIRLERGGAVTPTAATTVSRGACHAVAADFLRTCAKKKKNKKTSR